MLVERPHRRRTADDRPRLHRHPRVRTGRGGQCRGVDRGRLGRRGGQGRPLDGDRSSRSGPGPVVRRVGQLHRRPRPRLRRRVADDDAPQRVPGAAAARGRRAPWQQRRGRGAGVRHRVRSVRAPVPAAEPGALLPRLALDGHGQRARRRRRGGAPRRPRRRRGAQRRRHRRRLVGGDPQELRHQRQAAARRPGGLPRRAGGRVDRAWLRGRRLGARRRARLSRRVRRRRHRPRRRRSTDRSNWRAVG